MKSDFKFGKNLEVWKGGDSQTVTFVVTEDCNLRCKYCYITHKSKTKKMNFETAKKLIDYLLEDNLERKDAVIIEFIGGEPLLEVNLIDKITDYFKLSTYLKKDKWYWNYRISICTNGINYQSPDVQKYIKKNKGKLSLGITLDGTKEKHDLNRVFEDGSGSYDMILKSIPLWLNDFYPSTKVTFASDDLKYLKDSIINLYNLNITEIAANVVFENVWKENDDKIFENQLKELADFVIENKLYDKFKCSLFDENIGGYNTKEDLKKTNCGAGKMIALGPDGKIYPCIRYKDYSLNDKKEWTIGDINSGIDMEKVRPFVTAMTKYQSDQECLTCEVARGCGFCQGFNYDDAKTPTNFSRAKYICKMHKARVRANDYYFSRLLNEFGIEKSSNNNQKNLYFILDSNYSSFCQEKSLNYRKGIMDTETVKMGLKYAREYFYKPIFIHTKDSYKILENDFLKYYCIEHIIPAKYYYRFNNIKKYILVFSSEDVDLDIENIDNCILTIDAKEIADLSFISNKLISKANRVNLIIQNLNKNFDFNLYEKELNLIKDFILDENTKNHSLKEFNVLTDIFYLNEHDNCKAGYRNFTLGPDSNLYVCPIFYTNGKEAIGNLKSGIACKNGHLYHNDFHPICNVCNNFQCFNCIYLNQKTTNEVNVSPSFQCKKSSIEKKISYLMQSDIRFMYPKNDKLKENLCIDPIEQLLDDKNIQRGYYKINRKDDKNVKCDLYSK